MTGFCEFRRFNDKIFITRADPETRISGELFRSLWLSQILGRQGPFVALELNRPDGPVAITFTGVNATVTYQLGEYNQAGDTYDMTLIGDSFPRYQLKVVPWTPQKKEKET